MVRHDGNPPLTASFEATVNVQAPPPPQAERIPVVELFSSAQLDLALGRSNVIHAALLADRASDSFLARWRSLERFRSGVPEERRTS